MSKRRTRQQKISALAKNIVAPIPRSDAYFTSDLTRTVWVAILALFLEIMIKLYLERG